MSTLLKLIGAVVPAREAHEIRIDRYLAEAADIYDLERRIHELEHGSREVSHSLTFALGLR